MFTADEDFCKTSGPNTEKGLGYLRVYDYTNLAAPVQIGEYRTPNSLGADNQAAGDYSIHNALVVGTDVDEVRSVLEMVGFSQAFEIHTDFDTAVNSF